MTGTAIPRLAVVGCGAIAEAFYLPALASDRGLKAGAVLVDTDSSRLDQLSRRFGITRTSARYQDIMDGADAAIIATPPSSHATIASAFLERGKPVLAEKPLAATSAEAAELVQVAERNRVPLMVNNTRRLFPASQYIRDLISRGVLGQPSHVEYLEGGTFNWPTTSGFYFEPGEMARGVLLDRGSHVLDLICWWLGGAPEIVDYRDDSLGGPEANCALTARAADVRVTVHLSWLTKLANRCRVVGSTATLEGDVYDFRSVRLIGDHARAKAVRLPSRARTFNDYGGILVENLVQVWQGLAAPLVPGAQVLPSLQLIDRCYHNRRPFEAPWLRYDGSGCE